MSSIRTTFKNLIYLIKLCVSDCPRMLLINTSFGAIVAMQTILLIVMPKLILNTIIVNSNFKRALFYIVLLTLGESLCHHGLSYFSELSSIYNDKIVHDMLLRLSQKATRISYADIKRNELIEKYRLAQNVTFGMEYRVAILFCDFFSNFLKLATIITVISVVNGWMALAIFVLIVLKLLLVDYGNRKAMEFRYREESENVRYNYVLELCSKLAFAKEIRTYDVEKFMRKRYEQSRDSKFAIAKSQMRMADKLGFGENFADAMMVAISYLMIVYRYVKGFITISSFTMYLTALGEVYSTIAQILKTLTDLTDTNRLVEQYRKFMEYPENMYAKNKQQEIKLYDNNTIEFRNVSFKYPNMEQYALRNVNVVLSGGEKVGIVGENGAGKSTFVKLLLRLYDVSEGEILLNGVNIKNYDYDEYAKVFSVVPQDYALFFFGIAENIAFDKYKEEIDNVKKNLIRVDMLKKVEKLPYGMDTYLSKWFSKGTDFSGGETQRIAIARGLFRDAGILVMDEPNAAIDPIAEHIINQSVKQVSENKMVFNISHRLSMMRFCDHILVFDKGMLLEDGSHDKLMKDGELYKQMFDLQARYYQ